MAIFRLYLSIWFVSITLNRLWWAVFRWRLYPIRSRLARDLPTWLDLTATTGWTVCFFWIKHPNDNEKSKKYKFISFFLNLRWCFLLSFFINWAPEVPFIPIRCEIARNYIILAIIGWLTLMNTFNFMVKGRKFVQSLVFNALKFGHWPGRIMFLRWNNSVNKLKPSTK